MEKFYKPENKEKEEINRIGMMAAYNALEGIFDNDDPRVVVKICSKAFKKTNSAVRKAERQLTQKYLAIEISNRTEISNLLLSALACHIGGHEPEDHPTTSKGGLAIDSMFRVFMVFQHLHEMEYIMSCDGELTGNPPDGIHDLMSELVD